MTDWNTLISEVVAGKWKDPTTNKAATVPFEMIRIEESLDGGEADMIAPLKLGRRIAVVSDVNTNEAMGRRVAKHLKALGTIDELVLPGNTHCDEPTIAMVQETTRHADAVVAVGSGALLGSVVAGAVAVQLAMTRLIRRTRPRTDRYFFMVMLSS